MAAQNSNQPLASVLLLIATQSVELLGAFAVAIVKTDERSETASVQAFCGTQAGMDSGPAITVPYHTIRRAILSGQSAIILDPGDSPGQNKPAWASAVGPGVVLLAPIVVEAADFRGALLLHYTNRLSVTQAEIELVLLLVAQIVLSIEHAQLTAAALELATTNERQRVARELHDSVTQSLYSIILNSDATLLALQAGKPEKAELRLYQLKDIAREAMTELRLLIYELRPSNLEEQGLLAALQERLEVVETRSGVSVDLQIECDQILPMDVQNELFRVILEGLNNVIKHARAKRVKVMLVRHNDGCRLTIEDDGCGFDVNAARRYGGYGLKTMSERVQCIGGTLSVHSEPGAGATLEICIPV